MVEKTGDDIGDSRADRSYTPEGLVHYDGENANECRVAVGGKAALDELLRKIHRDYPGQDVWLSLHPQNTAAIQLYKSYGFEFEETGLETDDEVFMRLRAS